MDEPPPNYRREFLRSPHHGWVALITLGLGFLSASPLGLIAGGTAYVLSWIYLPDMPFFQRWVDRRHEAARRAAAMAQVAAFIKRRDAILDELSPACRQRYDALAEVCRNIEAASVDSPIATGSEADPRLRKLDELMWTFLRLLSIEESLERFLETERREDVPELTREAEQEVARLNAELQEMKDQVKDQGAGPALESRQRLLSSRQERLEVLRKRLQRIEQARQNLALIVSEQERLDQQIKLIRADAVASRNADALTARIDATVVHLDQTNKWLAELDEFKDLVGDLPATDLRVGFSSPSPPPVIEPKPLPVRARASLRQKP
ncbi:MAG: hypothetical protein M1608_09410 [Candidatus Omnitrophica bacterium]|nr:hypothetical protein [Candidatus Omnitrophota bacterium]